MWPKIGLVMFITVCTSVPVVFSSQCIVIGVCVCVCVCVCVWTVFVCLLMFMYCWAHLLFCVCVSEQYFVCSVVCVLVFCCLLVPGHEWLQFGPWIVSPCSAGSTEFKLRQFHIISCSVFSGVSEITSRCCYNFRLLCFLLFTQWAQCTVTHT